MAGSVAQGEGPAFRSLGRIYSVTVTLLDLSEGDEPSAATRATAHRGWASRLVSPVVLAFAVLVVVAVAVRAPLFPHIAYMAPNPVPFSDATVWEVWSRDLWEHGLDDLSQIEPKTYVGYHYVFWAVGQVYGFISPHFHIV